MGDLHDIAVERAKRKPRITTASRVTRPRAPKRPRKGDVIETTKGTAFVMGDDLLAWCKGEAFFLTPDMIARPEDGVA